MAWPPGSTERPSEHLSKVVALVETLEQASATNAPNGRQPGGLRGVMHTHEGFDIPLGEEFLIP